MLTRARSLLPGIELIGDTEGWGLRLQRQLARGETAVAVFGDAYLRALRKSVAAGPADWLKHLEEFGAGGANAALRDGLVKSAVLGAAATVCAAPGVRGGCVLFATCAALPCGQESDEYIDAGFAAKTTSLTAALANTQFGEIIFALSIPEDVPVLALEALSEYLWPADLKQVTRDHEVMTCPGQIYRRVAECRLEFFGGERRALYCLEYVGNIYATDERAISAHLEKRRREYAAKLYTAGDEEQLRARQTAREQRKYKSHKLRESDVEVDLVDHDLAPAEEEDWRSGRRESWAEEVDPFLLASSFSYNGVSTAANADANSKDYDRADGSADDGFADDGSGDDGSADDGSAGDGSAGDGSADDADKDFDEWWAAQNPPRKQNVVRRFLTSVKKLPVMIRYNK